MLKEQVLEKLAEMEWDDELKSELEFLVAEFVVYQIDPDTHEAYGHEYHMTEEDARKDYNERWIVPFGRWCYCTIASLKNDEIREKRVISI